MSAANLVLEGEALVFAAVSAVGLRFDPNAELNLFGIAYPYDHTVLIWAVTYLLVKRFYPLKPMYFIFLWGFQELAWNTVYFSARYPASLAWGLAPGIAQWDRYTMALAAVSAVGFLIIRRRLKVNWYWVAGFAVFEVVYFLSGIPIVNDRLAGTYVPSNWVWESVYNVVAMPFYLGMFREKKEQTGVPSMGGH